MGLMLTLDGPRQPRARHHGQHKRSPEEQVCVDAFAAFLRYDAAGAGRCLSRVCATVLAGRLLPAAKALAEAINIVLAAELRAGAWPAVPAQADETVAAMQAFTAGQIAAEGTVMLDFTVSPTCLLGMCRAGQGDCSSPLCEHDCHRAQRAAAGAAGA
jgi:hypothetical protein